MKRVGVTILAVFIFACNLQGEKTSADSPTEAYKMLYRAVKSKNPEEIKKWISQGTLMLAEAKANMEKSSVEKVIRNGFTETTFSASMPEIRDERISGDFGAVEVWNEKRRIWEDLPFIKETTVFFEFTGEDRSRVIEIAKAVPGMEIVEEGNRVYGNKAFPFSEAEELVRKLLEVGATARMENTSWRLAVGEIFNGVYKSPGKPRSLIEKEAANVANQSLIPQTNVNVNSASSIEGKSKKVK